MINKKTVPKVLIKSWEQHLKWLSEVAVVTEPIEQKEERIKRALEDYDYFVYTYFRHYCVDKNDNITKNGYFHREVAYKLLEPDSDKIFMACKWARNHAKSSHLSLFIPIWLTLHRKINHILICSKSTNDSVRLLQHIQGEFEKNENLIRDFAVNGSFIQEGSWTKNGIIINGYDCAFNITSKGGDPRGSRYKNYRIDFLIADDLDDKESIYNVDRINHYWDWFKESLLNVCNLQKFRCVYVQNLYSNNSIFYHYLTEIKDIYISSVNALKEDGSPTWFEKYSKDDLEFIKTNIGTISWLREYQNTSITTGSIFKQEWIKWGDIKLDNRDFVVMYFDPSWTSNSKSDFKSIQVVTKKYDKFYLIDTFTRQCSINTAVAWCYDQYDKYNSQGVVPYIYLESNFSQSVLWTEIQTVTKERGYQIPVIFDDHQKGNKFMRIEGMSSYFERGLIVFDRKLENLPDMKRLLDQLLGFENGSNMNDDSIDALESAIYWVNRNTRNFANTPLFDNHTENIKF